MTNTNCLQGIRCPKCRSEGPFWITAASQFLVSDDGAEDCDGLDWTDTNRCQCVACKHQGTVGIFSVKRGRLSGEEVDRLLGLGDELLDQWAHRAIDDGKRDVEYEERQTEWAAIRPLLRSAPSLLEALQALVAKADDLIAAIDEASDLFEPQVAALAAACTAAEAVIANPNADQP